MEPLHVQFVQRPDSIAVYFSAELHRRGTGFDLFRNEWVRAENRGKDPNALLTDRDSKLLRAIARRLIGEDDFGISKLGIDNYMLSFYTNPAVSREYQLEIIKDACREAGYEVIEGPRRLPTEPVATRWSEAYQSSDWLFFQDELARAFRWLGSKLKHAWRRLFGQNMTGSQKVRESAPAQRKEAPLQADTSHSEGRQCGLSIAGGTEARFNKQELKPLFNSEEDMPLLNPPLDMPPLNEDNKPLRKKMP